METKKSIVKTGEKLPYCKLPNNTMFFAGGYLCIKNSEKECFIFQTYSETEITDPNAIVEVAAEKQDGS